ncbi:hypothetical protein WL51_06955 [Burkholderia ubonensis]|uniref:hypothetical protein n=1 Tax=Burkholderia ubonensis TaxID=101571 RepID=UPI000752B686|nr:hypothetical protein [Burkholderia ubonensis]KWC40930.1 hypothetical protein WL51_06955 [Burkholderia ubonensis]
MQTIESRVLTLEAQVNAMAQAWLYLAAHVETQTGIDMTALEGALRRKRWPNNPEMEDEASAALNWLCDELSGARAVREARLQAEGAVVH